MNIVFVSYAYWPPDFGGELLLAIERLQSLARRGHEVIALTSGRPGYPERGQVGGIQVWRSPLVHQSPAGRGLRRVLFCWWVARRLQELSFDALHLGSMPDLPGVSGMYSALGTTLVSRVARAKGARILTVHALADSERYALDLRGMKGVWKGLYYRGIDVIVGVSPYIFAGLDHAFPGKAVLVPNAVRNDIFVPLAPDVRSRLRREWGVPDGGVVFLFLGSVGRRKGFDLLAQAFAELAPEHPNWLLWVIGPRTRAESQNLDEAEVREVTAPLAGLEAQVRYFGRVDDRVELARMLGAGDVFVFPSRREGFGLAPVEAMATGMPVIIARIPGVTDLANVEGETGLYIPPNDAEALRQAMERLGSDPALRQRMGQNAVRRVREAFSWEPYIDRWERLYRDGRVEPDD